MADNKTFQSATPATLPANTVAATKEVSFSGNTADVQLIEVVAVTGSEGSRTLNEISDASGLKIQDGGNTITVDGTVAVTHAALTELAAAIDTELQVDVVSSALPSGAATAANQSTANTALAAIQTAVEITEDNSASILTALQTIDNFISGSRGLVTEDNSAAALTALQLIDDIVATLGTTTYSEATTKGAVLAAVRRDADTTLVDTTNEIGPLQMNAAGQLKVEVFSGETLPVSLASVPSHAVTNAGTFAVQVDNTVTVGSHAVTNAGTFVTQIDGTALTRLTDIETNTDSNAVVGNGAAATAQRVTLANDSTGIVALTTSTASIGKLAANSGVDIGDVDVTSLPNVTLAAGTNTNEVVGDVAHDAGVGGNPVLIAGVSQDMDDTAPPNVVNAESDATRLATDRDGALFVHPHGPRVWSYHLDTSTAQTDTSVHSAPASGLSLYVTDIVFSHDGTAALNLFFEEGASKVLGPFYLPATAGGMTKKFATPKKITAATALTLTSSASHAHSVDITGFTAQG